VLRKGRRLEQLKINPYVSPCHLREEHSRAIA
jgi:hypothetical protein